LRGRCLDEGLGNEKAVAKLGDGVINLDSRIGGQLPNCSKFCESGAREKGRAREIGRLLSEDGASHALAPKAITSREER
jgi:hypothetical protein